MKKRIVNILEPAARRHGIWVVTAVMLCVALLGSLIACTSYAVVRSADGNLDMGSLFDVMLVKKSSIRVRGLSQNMTPQDVLNAYGLTEDDVTIIEETGLQNRVYALDKNVSFEEAREYPWTIHFYFNEAGDQLQRVMIGVFYVGAEWEDAHGNAMEIFEQTNKRAGKAITFDEWMQNYDYKGMVYNDFADSLESLSEFDSHYMRQYMYAGSKNNEGFALSMSYQNFSHGDTTKAFGQNVDELFGLSFTIPVKN